MNTRKNKNKRNNVNKFNKTKKLNTGRKNPILKILKKGHLMYGSKNKDIGSKILEYTKSNEIKEKKHCLYENISWFANLEQAKHYKKENDELFKWKVIKQLKLIKIEAANETFFRNLFLNTKSKINPLIKITENKLNKIDYYHPYLQLNNNERALYEFNFIFGYITLEEQYQFLLFLRYLIVNKYIDLLSRHDTSLLPKLKNKIFFYKYYPINKKEKYNRISFYELNKKALLNLCILLYDKYDIDGVYQPNTPSYWYPNLIIYQMNIEEFILFSPHTELINDGIIV